MQRPGSCQSCLQTAPTVDGRQRERKTGTSARISTDHRLEQSRGFRTYVEDDHVRLDVLELVSQDGRPWSAFAEQSSKIPSDSFRIGDGVGSHVSDEVLRLSGLVGARILDLHFDKLHSAESGRAVGGVACVREVGRSELLVDPRGNRRAEKDSSLELGVEYDELDDKVEERSDVAPAMDERETRMGSRRAKGTYQAAKGTNTAWLIAVRVELIGIER